VVDVGALCTALLRASPGWEVAYEDGMNAIFFRADTTGAPAAPRRTGSPPFAFPR